MNQQEKLKKYAKLLIEVGINIQKGQELMIGAPIDAAYFVRMLTECAYRVGAKKVYVDYIDEQITKMTYDMAPDEAFEEYPKWLADGKEELAKRGCAFLSISASNPDLLKDVDPKRIAGYQKVAAKALEPYRHYIHNGTVAWCVASIPTQEWSQKVFPNASPEEAEGLLWDKIFTATRVNEPDPVEAWRKHTDALAHRKQFLTKKKIKSLHCTGPGTDLCVELAQNHIWEGGSSVSKLGAEYVANMPTEEAFTAPYKYGVNGTLTATKPLSYGGNLIEEFVLHFKDGKVVDFSAEQGYDTLKNLIETDEGSCYLGEVAIVPHSSPVSKAGVIFFNTLFDENASCHFAFGNAYPDTIEGGTVMSKEELEKVGMNTSLTHVDFMVGGPEFNIEATTEAGEVFMILENGEWCF
ncbi:MAG: aminopeptidase [Cellulosilyticaceae bacterium]